MKHCEGKRYNFKKGFEICKFRDICKHYKHYLFLESSNQPTYEMPTVRHISIKEFRKCKLYKPNTINK